jgi:hypothetical protein
METKKQKIENTSQEDGKGETVRELARRHLLNEDHVTTDEELKNAKLELDGEVELSDDRHDIDGANPPAPIIDDKKKDEKDIPNPYDILGS